MGNGTRHLLTSWIVLAAYTASTAVLGHGIVLCEEPDGRTVVEIAGGHGQCADGLITAHDDADGVHGEDTECHDGGCAGCPCEDTSLAVEPAPVEKKSWASLALPAPAAQPGLAAACTPAPLTPLVGNESRVTLRSLRSVVLVV